MHSGLHIRDLLLGSVVAQLEAFGLAHDLEKCRVSRCDPATEDVAADEDCGSGEERVEEVERAHCSNANEVEDGALDPEIREGLMQSLVDPISASWCEFCHRAPRGWMKRERNNEAKG